MPISRKDWHCGKNIRADALAKAAIEEAARLEAEERAEEEKRKLEDGSE